MNRIKYIFNKVYYQNGYRIEPEKLPDWLELEIKEIDKDTKQLFVHSRIHINKITAMNPCYSSDFTDHEIIKDMSGKIFTRFIK